MEAVADPSGDVVMGDPSAELVLLAKAFAPEHMVLFRKLVQNVVDSPGETKFRKLKLSNARIGALLEDPGARQCFEGLGWIPVDGGEALELPPTADLSVSTAVLQGTVPPPPGEPTTITVLRGTSKAKLELPSNALLSTLVAAIEQSAALGRIPRSRQRLLAGVPPRPLEKCHPGCAAMTLEQMSLKAIKLEDWWEEMQVDLRACRASFAQLTSVLACRRTVQDNHVFLLESAKAMLKARAPSLSGDELAAARRCFRALWPLGSPATREGRAAWVRECTRFAAPSTTDVGEGGAPAHFLLEVDRANIFASAISQAGQVTTAQLQRPLDVRFQGEAAEDSGGPRREFFNEFGRAASVAAGIWSLTPAGAMVPATPACLSQSQVDVFRSCGRICGLALCQVENAAQEQQVDAANATMADLLAAVRVPAEEQPRQQQKLMLGVPLSRAFLRVVQGDAPEALAELQAELNLEQGEGAPDFRGSDTFLKLSLAELGLEGQLTFSFTSSDGSVVDLVAGGSQVVATDTTKLDWLKATLRYQLVDSVGAAATAFREGVCEVAGAAHFVLLSADELCEEWSGKGSISDDDLRLWQSTTTVNPKRRQQAAWFFDLLWEKQMCEMRPRVLKFATGSDRWPSDPKGFSFCIEPMDGGDEALPRAMTCGNMLQLPNYTSPELLRTHLLKACDWGLSMHLI